MVWDGNGPKVHPVLDAENITVDRETTAFHHDGDMTETVAFLVRFGLVATAFGIGALAGIIALIVKVTS